MPSFELPASIRMNRVAVIAPKWLARDVLVNLAVSGNMEIIGDPTPATGPAADALARLQRTVKTTPSSRLQRREPDIRKLEADGAADLLSGEVELERYIDMAVEHGRVVAFVGWVPEADVPALTGQLADVGASVVKLQIPSGQDPPTLQPPRRASRSFRPLMDAYGVLPYSDIDSTGFAAVAFVLMFGMMFGDVGHGAVLTAIGIFLARGIGVRYRSIRPAAPLLIACGISGMAFGFLYGEFFGPTGIIEPLWLSPLDEPLMLFAVAVVFGATLLAISYLLGTVNRWREGGPRSALYASSGLAGASVFVAIAVAVLGMITGVTGWYLLAMLLAGIGLVLLFIGSYSEAGGGGTGVTLAVVSVFETTLRTMSSGVSFIRLAAFGMMHAALSLVIWNATVALVQHPWGWPAAIVVFIVGTALAIALEALVAAIQALRLEYYEMFSRVYWGEGRVFTPFRIELVKDKELI